MLIDKLHTLTRAFDDFAPVLRKIEDAPRFELGEDFARLADSLCQDWEQEARLLPFARPPFEECWIEVAQAHRPVFLRGAPADPNKAQMEARRIGYYIQAARTDFTAWVAHLFWSFAPPRHDDASTACSAVFVDTVGTEAAVLQERNGCRVWSGREGVTLPAAIAKSHCSVGPLFGAETWRRLRPGAVEVDDDWNGEVSFLTAALILLNTKNVVEVAPPRDAARINKARARNGKPPIFGFHTCRISREHHVAARTTGSGDAAPHDLRAHFVRGHFKVRKTGVFWWSPHARGDLSRGLVAKDYQVHS